MRRFVMAVLALGMLLSLAVAAEAVTVSVYTVKTEWENAVGGQYLTEKFEDDVLNTGVSFVSSESGGINTAPDHEYYQDVLASTSNNEPQTVWSFTPKITAYGGNWKLGGPGGSGNSLLVYIQDYDYFVESIPNSYGGEFWGFTSDTPFTSVKLVGGSGTNQQNYRLDNMVYSPVPLPGTLGLLGGGLLGLFFFRRKVW